MCYVKCGFVEWESRGGSADHVSFVKVEPVPIASLERSYLWFLEPIRSHRRKSWSASAILGFRVAAKHRKGGAAYGGGGLSDPLPPDPREQGNKNPKVFLLPERDKMPTRMRNKNEDEINWG